MFLGMLVLRTHKPRLFVFFKRYLATMTLLTQANHSIMMEFPTMPCDSGHNLSCEFPRGPMARYGIPRSPRGFPVGSRGTDWDFPWCPAGYREINWAPVGRSMGVLRVPVGFCEIPRDSWDVMWKSSQKHYNVLLCV